jgi:uncharacterized protein YoaH (UPF0181 family)
MAIDYLKLAEQAPAVNKEEKKVNYLSIAKEAPILKTQQTKKDFLSLAKEAPPAPNPEDTLRELWNKQRNKVKFYPDTFIGPEVKETPSSFGFKPDTEIRGPLNIGERIQGTVISDYKNLQKMKSAVNAPVESLADWIEPDSIPAEGPTLLTHFPRLLLADTVRSYKPSDVALFWLGGKTVKGIGQVAGPAVKTAYSKYAPAGVKKASEKISKFLARNLTVGRGQPKGYIKAADKAILEKLAGAREAEEAVKVLTTKASGKLLTGDEQLYVGRIFRQEIDLGGKKSRILQSPELVERITTEIAENISSSKTIQGIKAELRTINSALNNKLNKAKKLIGKKFRTETGFIEEAADVVKIPKTLKSGKPSTKSFDVQIVTKPVTPAPPTSAPIPQTLAKGEQQILRTPQQVARLGTVEKSLNLSRKELLAKRKLLAQKLTKKVQEINTGVRSMYDIFDRTFTEQLRLHPKFQELSKIAYAGREIMDTWSRELVKAGVVKGKAKEVIEKNINEYMARIFTKRLNVIKTTPNSLMKNLRLRLNGLKHKKNLSEKVLKDLGEIKEISSAVANNELFKTVAANPEWVASKNVTGKMVQMIDSPRIGALKGKWVVREIADDINFIFKTENKAIEMYKKTLGAWKYGKVVLNPATQFRNIVANTILLDMSGVSHVRQLQLMPEVLKDYLKKGPVYQAALKSGGIGGEFVGSEVERIMKTYIKAQGGHLGRMMDLTKKPFKKAGEFYQAMEQISKLVKFHDVLSKGGSIELAAKEAQKWLFNYNKLPKVISFAKNVSPFITFTYKALPRIAETMVERPLKIFKYYALTKAWNEAARKQTGMSKEQYEDMLDNMPDYKQTSVLGMPTTILMPWKNKEGKPVTTNIEYYLPIGMAPEILQKGLKGGKGVFGLLDSPLISNPAYQAIADLQKNKDGIGREIFPKGTTDAEAAKIGIEYIYRQAAPSLAPSLGEIKGGYSYEKLMNVVNKRPDKKGILKSVPAAVLEVLAGLKVTPVDTVANRINKRKSKKALFSELKRQVRDTLRDKSLTPKEKEKKRLSLLKKMGEVYK